MDMKSFWNERYGSKEYVYGKAPNEFFKSVLDTLPAGRLLLPCEGEGRNAVYAATKGWQVDAFDQSEAGQAKCRQLASECRVDVNYTIADATEFDYGENRYSLIALIYAHFPSSIRSVIHANCLKALQPGGLLVIEAFTPEQLQYQSGGPKDPDMLYTPEKLSADVKDMEILQLETLETHLEEGPFHSGKGAIIRLIARKK